jgi:hypothetical protein
MPIRAYKHLKTGNVYFVVGQVVNATNGKDNELMILYENEHGRFVREESEFFKKFKRFKHQD